MGTVRLATTGTVFSVTSDELLSCTQVVSVATYVLERFQYGYCTELLSRAVGSLSFGTPGWAVLARFSSAVLEQSRAVKRMLFCSWSHYLVIWQVSANGSSNVGSCWQSHHFHTCFVVYCRATYFGLYGHHQACFSLLHRSHCTNNLKTRMWAWWWPYRPKHVARQ
jgi:hypothetical protein